MNWTIWPLLYVTEILISYIFHKTRHNKLGSRLIIYFRFMNWDNCYNGRMEIYLFSSLFYCFIGRMEIYWFCVSFLAGNQLYELKTNRRGWWGGQKKTIAIFAYKQRLLSIEMKTKLVQHVESDWMRDWKSVRVRKSESEREWEWESVRVSFEHRHENKSCSEHSNIDTFQVPSFCLTFRHFFLLLSVFISCLKQTKFGTNI